MQINPYLHSFNGRCEEAFKFYEQCLGGKIVALYTFGDSPMACDTPTEMQNKIMHARLVVGSNVIMGSDSPPEYFEKPQGFSVNLSVETPVEAERIFEALAEKGTIRHPLAETFWAVRFGMLVDQFGIPWMVNCEKTQ